MRVPGLALVLVLVGALLSQAALATAQVPTGGADPRMAAGSGETAVHLVAEDKAAPEDKGGGGFVTGLSAAGLGCLVGVLPSAFMGFACGFLGAPCAFPCLLLGSGGGALLGAGIESGFDGAHLFAPTLVGALIGGSVGLVAATAGVITALVAGNTAGRVSPNTNLATNATAVGVITSAVVGGVALVGALGAGIGSGIAYALSGGSEEAAPPTEVEVAPPPVDQPPPQASQPKPEDVQPKPEPPTPDQPATDDPDMKGFFY